ncbi:MAG: 4Fe-4S dicluster domain-containing protein [Chloroflexi bacterium]|nr:4Fe-4S dicluster domain-containing protein [Chloroflexota bacterium]OJV87329.1 MAG: 4Fe-4S ferredoxin [Chloroflexi bacterium 54-19]
MATGFFTDTTLCIGCKACEVACKQWNQLPADGYAMTGMSYDNTGALGATTWRHVAFIEVPASKKRLPMATPAPPPAAVPSADGGNTEGLKILNINGEAALQVGFPDIGQWLMMSDVCKHCTNAGCLQACPTGAIIRNEFGAVYVQPDICNGCGYCVPSCPFGVVALQHDDGRAFKCTLCYDRQKDGLEPACAKACPTDSITFGDLDDLKMRARQRVAELHARGETSAYLYGVDEETEVGDLNAFFLLKAEPEAYGLPVAASLPQNRVTKGFVAGFAVAAVLSVFSALAFKRKHS